MQNNIVKKKKGILNIILLYLYILFSCGYYFHEHRIAFTGPLIIAVLLNFKNRFFKFQRKYFVILITLIINMILSSIFAGDNIDTIILSIMSIISAYLIFSAFSKQIFIELYVNLIFILSIGSIVLFILNLINPAIFSIFPKLVDSHNIIGYYSLFSTVTMKTQWIAARNASIFWEPGVFQTFIILTFAFEMSKFGMKRNVYGVVFLVAIITTLSTTGLICLCIMIIIWLLEINRKKNLKSIRIIISFVVILALYLSFSRFIPQGISNRLDDKFMGLLNGDNSNFSVSTRIDSIIYPLKSFKSSPLIGVGSKGLSSWTIYIGHSLRTCTPLNWFARFGIFFGIIANVGFTQIRNKMYNLTICNILLPILLLLSIFSEAYTVNAAILIFVFLGLDDEV